MNGYSAKVALDRQNQPSSISRICSACIHPVNTETSSSAREYIAAAHCSIVRRHKLPANSSSVRTGCTSLDGIQPVVKKPPVATFWPIATHGGSSPNDPLGARFTNQRGPRGSRSRPRRFTVSLKSAAKWKSAKTRGDKKPGTHQWTGDKHPPTLPKLRTEHPNQGTVTVASTRTVGGGDILDYLSH